MLYQFIEANRDQVITRARGMVAARLWPVASPDELETGIPHFLTQLTETLREALEPVDASDRRIHQSAALHGRALLAQGFTFSQVVHDYGDVCQAITGLAVELQAPISVEEFQTLNRCLDTAIAGSVSEFGRLREEATADLEAERTGHLAHELRNKLHSAMLAFHVLRTGTVGMTGSTVGLLGRSLLGLQDLLDASIVEGLLAAAAPRPRRVNLKAFVEELAIAASLHAEYRGVALKVEPVDAALAIDVDLRLLTSAISNLLVNAFKYTRPHTQVTLRTRSEGGRVYIEVEDQCGGLELAPGVDPFEPALVPSADGRAGLGLGLSICRKAVQANGGLVRMRNSPGQGCTFEIELPAAAPAAAPAPRPAA